MAIQELDLPFHRVFKKRSHIDLTNCHMLILDGNNSHVVLEVVKISMESGLDIVSLLSHTSKVFQPLDVACFKTFKIAFKKIRDVWLLINKNRAMGSKLCTNGHLKH